MAKIKPVADTSKPIVGLGSRLDKIGIACDVIGMTDIPVVSQLGELTSAGISVATGDYIGAALSIGSMVPVVGKAAEAAKVTHRAKKVADGVAAAGKEAKLLSVTAKKADDVADVAKQSKKVGDAAPKPSSPQPSKTQAKDVNKKPSQEIQDDAPHFDSDKWLGLDKEKPVGDSIFSEGYTPSSSKLQKSNYEKFNYSTNSNPALNNKFGNTGKPRFGI